MAKKIKAVFYGEPGVGKSTLLSKSEAPLFLTTDGNFDWLDLPDENHVQLSSWKQAKLVFADIVGGKYSQFKTFVVDLIEDLYMWCEHEFCKDHKIDHIGDYGAYGKGYSVVRDDFLAEIGTLLSVDANVVFLSHETLKVEKDRRGAENHKYYPSSKMSLDNVWTVIEGKVRYFLRCYVKPEEINGKIVKKRYLSINPKENEYGIARGLDETNTPDDIPLEWDAFTQIAGLNSGKESKNVHVYDVEQTQSIPVEEPIKQTRTRKPAVKKEEPIVPVEANNSEATDMVVKLRQQMIKEKEITKEEIPFDAHTQVEIPAPVEEVKSTVVNSSKDGPTSAEDVTRDMLIAWAKANTAINQLEEQYGFKFTQQLRVDFVKIKMEIKKGTI